MGPLLGLPAAIAELNDILENTNWANKESQILVATLGYGASGTIINIPDASGFLLGVAVCSYVNSGGYASHATATLTVDSDTKFTDQIVSTGLGTDGQSGRGIPGPMRFENSLLLTGANNSYMIASYWIAIVVLD